MHYIFTDGAPSHFKNRWSLDFLLSLSFPCCWNFNAPSHGKGPWDGLGATIKTLVRRMEKYPKFPGHVYCATQADVFFFLAQHYSNLSAAAKGLRSRTGRIVSITPDNTTVDVGVGGAKDLVNVLPTLVRPLVEGDGELTMGSSVEVLSGATVEFKQLMAGPRKKSAGLVDEILFHYIKLPDDDMSAKEKAGWMEGGKYVKMSAEISGSGHTVMDPVDRTQAKPDVRIVAGIRNDYFCFLTLGKGRIACRRRSCFCTTCMKQGKLRHRIGKRCENYEECGDWVITTVRSNDETWDYLMQLLRDEGGKGKGYNTTKKWNDSCGCLKVGPL